MTALVNPFWYAPTGATDPFFANVVLLCHFDGANGATTTVDSSSSHKTIVLTGAGSVLTTAQAKFGTASLVSTTSCYAALVDSADWDFGTGQFTIEAFIRSTSTITNIRVVAGRWAAGSLAWVLRFSAAGLLEFYYSTTGADSPGLASAYVPATNAWVHVVVDRDASNLVRLYADGVVVASATHAATFFASTSTLYVGNDQGTTRAFIGQIDELRITKGVARYGGAFTPPAAPFPDA